MFKNIKNSSKSFTKSVSQQSVTIRARPSVQAINVETKMRNSSDFMMLISAGTPCNNRGTMLTVFNILASLILHQTEVWDVSFFISNLPYNYSDVCSKEFSLPNDRNPLVGQSVTEVQRHFSPHQIDSTYYISNCDCLIPLSFVSCWGY